MEKNLPFSDSIFQLRENGSMVIFSALESVSKAEEEKVTDYLQTEFEKERLEFLSTQINFDPEAALWAAKIVYHSAQLYLMRKNTAKNLSQLIPEFRGRKDASAHLSADLLLRFVPQIIFALQNADPDDTLIKMLENILLQCHYSGIGCDLDWEKINWEEELKDKTYRKLYLERIVEKKDYKLAEIPAINTMLMAEFGMHKNIFWRELKIINEEHQ